VGLLSRKQTRTSSRTKRVATSAGTALASSLLRGIPIVRWIGPSTTIAGVLAVVGFLTTGRIDFSKLNSFTADVAEPASGAAIQPVSLKNLGMKTAETIRIATFNIKVFGESKSQDSNVMGVLAQVINQFDLIAIQEVRGGDSRAIDRLIQLVNVSGGNYASILSEPIGRTSQKESYAFVWDQSRIMLVPNSAYVVQDAADRMHREPMVASFEVRLPSASGRLPFSFNIISAHTDPDEVSASTGINELDVLDDVFVRVRDYEFQTNGQEDTLLVGDLNVDVAGLSELGRIPNVVSVAGNVKTNTLRTKTYDHVVLDRTVTTEFTGRFGVLDFQTELGLTQEQANAVSDHQPVWAEFSAFESVRQPAMAVDPRSAVPVQR
jgi:deoxyribonuclease-1-like protein